MKQNYVSREKLCESKKQQIMWNSIKNVVPIDYLLMQIMRISIINNMTAMMKNNN